MKTYFLSVILVALFGGICEELLPEGGGMRHPMRFVTGLCVLAVLVLPAKDAIVGIGRFLAESDLGGILSEEAGDLEDYEAVLRDSLAQFAADEAERSLARTVEERFGLAKGSCRAELTLTDAGKPERVLVCLSGFSVLKDPREVAEYVSGLLGCPCDVAVE